MFWRGAQETDWDFAALCQAWTLHQNHQTAKVITGCCPLVAPKHSLKVNPAFFLRDASFSGVSILLLGSDSRQRSNVSIQSWNAVALRLLWWALPIVNLFKASTLLAFSALYAYVVAKSESWFGGHHYVCYSDMETKKVATLPMIHIPFSSCSPVSNLWQLCCVLLPRTALNP